MVGTCGGGSSGYGASVTAAAIVPRKTLLLLSILLTFHSFIVRPSHRGGEKVTACSAK